MIPGIFYSFVDGKNAAGLITAARLNGNLEALFTWANGNVDADNIIAVAAVPASQVMVTDRDYLGANKITGSHEFSVLPTFPAGSIPLPGTINTFTAKQVLGSGMTAAQVAADFNKAQAANFNLERVAAPPVWVAADDGRLIYDTVAGKVYLGQAAIAGWLDISTQVFAPPGTTMFCYSAINELDNLNSTKLFFKTNGAPVSVKLAIKGEPFPKRHYTDLPYHTHVFTGGGHTHAVTDAGHAHNVAIGSHTHPDTFGAPTHTHDVGGNTGNASSVSHTHGAGTLAADAVGTHSHTVSGTSAAGSAHGHASTGLTITAHATHWHSYNDAGGGSNSTGSTVVGAHTLGGSVANESAHTHAKGSFAADAGGGHSHTVSGTSASGGVDHHHTFSDTSTAPSATAGITAYNYGTIASAASVAGLVIVAGTETGTNAYAGVNIATALTITQKLYAKALAVAIDGTSITADILTATGWAEIGNGTGTHAFHTTGTPEIDTVPLIAYGAGLHVLEISEGVLDRGCRVMIHIEVVE